MRHRYFWTFMTSMAVDTLPNEVLGAIFQLISGEPTPALLDSAQPSATTVTRVSRRWRAVALDDPTLWTTIRISPRPQSWHWAALCIQRSRARSLDLSINLERYDPCAVRGCTDPYDPDQPKRRHYINVEQILAILGPHAVRWRTVAVQGWYTQVHKILCCTHTAGAQLESVHIALLDDIGETEDSQLQALVESVDTKSLHALRISRTTPKNPSLFFNNASLSMLDIQVDIESDIGKWGIPQLVESMPSLMTLILRNIYPGFSGSSSIASSTIRSFAISFRGSIFDLRAEDYSFALSRYENFNFYQFLTETFLFSNLEHLEIFGGVLGLSDSLHLPPDWEAAAFPRLHTLRLEDLQLNGSALAQIQALSRGITQLTLANTWGADGIPGWDVWRGWCFRSGTTLGGTLGGDSLLETDAVQGWRDLKTLTVESLDHCPRTRYNPRSQTCLPHKDNLAWLSEFLKRRAELRMPLTELVVSPSVAANLRRAVVRRGPAWSGLRYGAPALIDEATAWPATVGLPPWPQLRELGTPSPALIDGGVQPGSCRFYLNSLDQYTRDFEPVYPPWEWWCSCGAYLGELCDRYGDRDACYSSWHDERCGHASSWISELEDALRTEDLELREEEIAGDLKAVKEEARTREVVQRQRIEGRRRRLKPRTRTSRTRRRSKYTRGVIEEGFYVL